MGRQSNGNFGTDIVLTGDQAYRATMKDIASQMRLVKSELALADAEYKNNDDSVAALTARYGRCKSSMTWSGRRSARSPISWPRRKQNTAREASRCVTGRLS